MPMENFADKRLNNSDNSIEEDLLNSETVDSFGLYKKAVYKIELISIGQERILGRKKDEGRLIKSIKDELKSAGCEIQHHTMIAALQNKLQGDLWQALDWELIYPIPYPRPEQLGDFPQAFNQDRYNFIRDRLGIMLPQDPEAVDKGLRDIQTSLRILNNVEENTDRNWWDEIENEGKETENQFTEANLRLVIAIAEKYRGLGLPLLDLVQEGNDGLMIAVGKYDYRKGYKFSTYGTGWIKQRVTRAIANDSHTIRHPVYIHDLGNRKRRIETYLTQEYGRMPTTEEIAQEMKVEVETVLFLDMINKKAISLDKPAYEEDGSPDLIDLLGNGNPYFNAFISATEPDPQRAAEDAEMKEAVMEAVKELPPKEYKVLYERFGLGGKGGKTLEKIGKEIRKTRERVRQIESKALRTLRESEKAKELKDFLE